jgi:hypothetical protein
MNEKIFQHLRQVVETHSLEHLVLFGSSTLKHSSKERTGEDDEGDIHMVEGVSDIDGGTGADLSGDADRNIWGWLRQHVKLTIDGVPY